MKKNLPQAILFAFILVYSLCSKSCANTSTPPMGGAKDTIPPVMVSIEPPEYSVNFPTKLKKSKIKNISFRFNEYVVVKEAQKNIFLSPPQTKAPKYRISGKSVKITFEEALDSNTT